jgi:NNP family nitrate/nitrite transporter-like MFS transporter
MLFIFSGIGNGSTYKMIPAIFHAKAQLEVGAGLDLAEADHRAIRRSEP